MATSRQARTTDPNRVRIRTLQCAGAQVSPVAGVAVKVVSLPIGAGPHPSDPSRCSTFRSGGRVRIAIVGTRGIPAAYGGFETLAWELSSRLAERGHEVTVYSRRGRTDETRPLPPGVRRRFVPFVPGKYLETVSHTGMSVLDSLLRGYDAMWVGNAANAVFCAAPRLRGTKVVLNVDGIERQRRSGAWPGGSGTRSGSGWPSGSPTPSSPTLTSSPTTTASATTIRRTSSPMAPGSSIATRRRTSPGTGWKASRRAATSSTSAGWSPRTRPTW